MSWESRAWDRDKLTRTGDEAGQGNSCVFVNASLDVMGPRTLYKSCLCFPRLMSKSARGVEARSNLEGPEPSGLTKDLAHQIVQHTLDMQTDKGHGNGTEPRVTGKDAAGGQDIRTAARGTENAAPAGPKDARLQQQQSWSLGRRARPDQTTKTQTKPSEVAADQGQDVSRKGGATTGAWDTGKTPTGMAPSASEGVVETTTGAARDTAGTGLNAGKAGARGNEAVAKARGEAAAGGTGGVLEQARRAGRDSAGVASAAAKGAESAAKSAAGATAKGDASGGRAAQAGPGATVEYARSAGRIGPVRVAEAVGKGTKDVAKMALGGAGKTAVATMDAPSVMVRAAKDAAGTSRKTIGFTMSSAWSTAQAGRGAVRTGSRAVGAGADAAQRGVVQVVQGVQTLMHWWYFLAVQLPYRLASGSLHMGWVAGNTAASAAARGAVRFLDLATWAGELAYRWLLDGIQRVNHGMDAAISATPPLVKGQLARAAVVEAPEGPNLVDSLSNKSPAQIGKIFRGLTAVAAAAKQEPLVVGGEARGPGGLGRGGQDLVEQVNAALHAAFDRPDVALEADWEKPALEQDEQQLQPGEARTAPGGSVEALRSADILHDKLVDQARLLVWHFWMVGRLQLTAAAEVAAVTRGMWSWLLRCVAHLAAALGLLAAMAAAAAGGAFVAAGAWALASGVRQLRSAAKLEVRARRIWAPIVLRAIDTLSAVAGPLLRGSMAPSRSTGNAAALDAACGKEQEGGIDDRVDMEERKGSKGIMAKAASAMAPLWEAMRSGQAYARDTLTTAQQFTQSLVPKDPEREEAEAARAVEAFAGLSAVLNSSERAFDTTWRLAQASMAALTDLTGNLITDVARRYHVPLPKFAWLKGKAAKLAQDTAISSFAKVAGTVPATVVAGMVGAAPPFAAAGGKPSANAGKDGAQAEEGLPAEGELADGCEGNVAS
ncbi:hypothetical protein Vafri_155 [Volvox africanus]|nr:hypothetical protein Vafri_155 [Volvox africanus]